MIRRLIQFIKDYRGRLKKNHCPYGHNCRAYCHNDCNWLRGVGGA